MSKKILKYEVLNYVTINIINQIGVCLGDYFFKVLKLIEMVVRTEIF